MKTKFLFFIFIFLVLTSLVSLNVEGVNTCSTPFVRVGCINWSIGNITSHNELAGLDYASAGHTGFEPTITNLGVNRGGTGRTSWTQFSIPYLSATTTFGQISIGTNGQCLKVNSTEDGYEFGACASSESEPLWQGNYSRFLTHINWSQVINGTLYLSSNPYNFWNSSNYGGIGNWSADKPNYNTTSQLYNIFYNLSNPYGYYNSSNPPDISDLSWNNDWMIAYSNTAGLVELPFGDKSGKFLRSNGEGALTWEDPSEPLWSGNSSTVARIGNCPSGQVVQNTTNTGVQCVVQGSGTGTFNSTSGGYVYNDTAYDITFNETKMNNTIDIRLDNGTIIRQWNTTWISNNVGNWSSDKINYNTTSQLYNIFYNLSNPYNFWNASYYGGIGNFSAENSTLARRGTSQCSAGQYAYNATTNGGITLVCSTPTGTNNSHTHNAANITTGTFGTGNYTFNGNVNVTGQNNYTLDNGSTCYGIGCAGRIYYNGSALIIRVT